MGQQFPILRSGFVGLSMAGLQEPREAFDRNVAAILNKSRLVPDNNFFYHEGVQQLFVKMLREAQLNVLHHLDVQEQILRVAKEAFGATHFWEWVDFQSGKPTMTSAHEEFVVDTLKYLSGMPRQIEVQQWVRLLEADVGPNARGTIRDNKYYEHLASFRNSNAVPNRLHETLTTWVRRPGGFHDLMCSLATIFGNRRTLNQSV